MRDTIADFQVAISCESVIERDPAKGEPFCRTWTFEVFIQRGLRQCIGARPAVTSDDEGWQVILVTEPVHHIKIDQSKLRRGGRPTRMSWGDRTCGCTRWSG